MRAPDPQTSIEEAAAQWIVRRDAGLTAEEEQAFAAWKNADPRHAAAVAGYDEIWTALDRPRTTGRTPDLTAALARVHRRRRQSRLRTGAALVVAACLGATFWPRAEPPRAPAPAASLARVLGPARQPLPDGSVIEHAGNAEFAVAFATRKRQVTLRSGQAHFEVARDPERPFVIVAKGYEVRAIGTAFGVEVSADAVEVVVTHGTVALARADLAPGSSSSDPAPLLMVAGQRARIDLTSHATPLVAQLSERELRERMAWRSPRAEFSRAPLSEVIATVNAELGATGEARFEIADPAIAAMSLSGVFRLDDTAALLHVLEQSFGIVVEREGDRRLLRRPAASAPPSSSP